MSTCCWLRPAFRSSHGSLNVANAVPGAEGGEALPFDAIVIVLILIVNAVLGYIQESKAEAAVEALSSMTAPQTNGAA